MLANLRAWLPATYGHFFWALGDFRILRQELALLSALVPRSAADSLLDVAECASRCVSLIWSPCDTKFHFIEGARRMLRPAGMPVAGSAVEKHWQAFSFWFEGFGEQQSIILSREGEPCSGSSSCCYHSLSCAEW